MSPCPDRPQGRRSFVYRSVGCVLGAWLTIATNGSVAIGQVTGPAVEADGMIASASPLDKPARLTLGVVGLMDALLELRNRSGVYLAFSPSLIPKNRSVTCPCEKMTVGQALDWLLVGTRLEYSTLGNRVLIEPSNSLKPAVSLSKRTPEGKMVSSTARVRRTIGMVGAAAVIAASPLVAQQTGTIQGMVVERDTRQPLVAAQVFVPDTDLGTITDQSGRFQLLNVPAGEVELHAQSIGYSRSTQVLTVRAGAVTTVEFELRTSAIALDEVVVTGTAGQARRREVGQTVAQINMANVAEPVTSVDHLLQGRATSMTVSAGTGTMGSGAQIRLRGNVSVTQSNQPLIYIDGVRQGAEKYPTPTSSGIFSARTHATASPLNDLNPNDIERIEVVKGAAATTLYGSEAAAGVIQIFTRRGTAGTPRWTYQTDQRFDRVQKFGSPERPFINMEPFLKTAYGQRHSLSVSGGPTDTRYYVSALFDDGKGVHPNDEETRWGLRGNLNLQPTPALGIQWNTSYSEHDMTITHVGNNTFSLQFNAYRAPNNTVGSSDPEVIARLLDAKIFQNNTRFNSGLTVTYAPTTNLTNRLVVGLDRVGTDIRHVTPYGYIVWSEGYIDEHRWASNQWSLEYTGSLSYGVLEDLNARLSWGGQSITRDESSLKGFGTGLPGPGQHTLSSTAQRQTFSEAVRVVDAGLFLENMFDFRNRYFLTFGVRVDGNSTFGSDLGFQVYPKVSGSYVISDESFWRDGWGEVRLRGAYGQAGRAPGPFDAVRTWSALSYAGHSAFLPLNIGNPNLGPERTSELELGFEGSFLDDRVQVSFTRYHQHTVDALLEVAQLPSLGFTGGQLENVGELQNQGLEFEVNGAVIRGQNFEWHLGASLATNHSEVLDTGDREYDTIVVGHPIPVLRGDRVVNAKEFADPILERNVPLGPRHPTRIVGLHSTFELPHGIQLSARGEYQGGFWAGQGQSAMVDRGAGAPACDPGVSGAYRHVPYFEYAPDHPGLAQVNALDRVRCYRQTYTSGIWNGRADFFKIRDITLKLPVGFAVPATNDATLTFSLRNIRVWHHEDFPIFDPEMSTDISALTAGPGSELTPSPMRATISLRASF